MQRVKPNVLLLLNVIALVLAVVWAIRLPSLESAVAAVLAASGLIGQGVVRSRTRVLEILFEPGRPFEQVEPAGAAGKAIRYFSVGIKNTGTAALDDCLVKLTGMKAIDGRHFENVFLPIGLVTQQQQLQGRRGGPFRLRCGETKYVRVVALNETDDAAEIVLSYEDPTIPNMVPRGSYLLTVQALGAEEPQTIALRVDVGKDGSLRVRRYGAGNA